DRKRYVQDLRQRLGKQRLATAGGTKQQDVGLLQLDVVFVGLHHLDALVVVVDRYRERPLGLLLADDVLVQNVVDLPWLGEILDVEAWWCGELFIDDLVAEVDALIADVDARARDQLLDLALRLPAEAAKKLFVGVGRTCHGSPPRSDDSVGVLLALEPNALVLGDHAIDDSVLLGLL